ncbi:hypothetical protein AABB87_06325 [Roseateles sp. PN1]
MTDLIREQRGPLNLSCFEEYELAGLFGVLAVRALSQSAMPQSIGDN